VAATEAAAAIAVALMGMLVGEVVAKVVLFKECEEAKNEKRAVLEEERRQERERLEAVRREREAREEAERAREREEMRMVQEELENAALVEAELLKQCKDALDFVIGALERIENEIIAEREREETERRAVHVQAAVIVLTKSALCLIHKMFYKANFNTFCRLLRRSLLTSSSEIETSKARGKR